MKQPMLAAVATPDTNTEVEEEILTDTDLGDNARHKVIIHNDDRTNAIF